MKILQNRIEPIDENWANTIRMSRKIEMNLKSNIFEEIIPDQDHI